MQPSSSHRYVVRAACVTVAAVVACISALPAAGPSFTFSDITKRAGISFVHDNGAAGAFWYPELFGGGVAVLDVDGDRAPDLLFLSGKPWTPGTRARHALYRNNRNGTFTDITAGSGFDTLDVYGVGATVSDFDNDGRDDVFVTTTEGGRLLRNAGTNRFVDVTAQAGIHRGPFAVSAAWLDYDKDGRVDLLVGNYVQWSPAAES
ncbi:MAG: VCBS repeat-containing protein, partial [Vicinamibacterales bacterium]